LGECAITALWSGRHLKNPANIPRAKVLSKVMAMPVSTGEAAAVTQMLMSTKDSRTPGRRQASISVKCDR